MDLLTAAVARLGPVVHRIPRTLWEAYQAECPAGQGTAVSAQGDCEQIPCIAGVPSIPAVPHLLSSEARQPIDVAGQFTAAEPFVALANVLLEEAEKTVLLILIDQGTEAIYILAYGFDGYALQLWTGAYTCYAFIVDPIGDEVLAAGYPRRDGFDDPNPITIGGTGPMHIDFILWDLETIEEVLEAGEGWVSLSMTS